MMFILSLFVIFLLYCAYYYLDNLNTCRCVNNIYTEKLKYLESILIVISLFMLAVHLYIYSKFTNFMKPFMKYVIYGTVLFSLSMLVLYSYFVYDTYKFIVTMKRNCKCADKWEKYYIYYQAAVFSFILLFSAISGVAILGKSIMKKI